MAFYGCSGSGNVSGSPVYECCQGRQKGALYAYYFRSYLPPGGIKRNGAPDRFWKDEGAFPGTGLIIIDPVKER